MTEQDYIRENKEDEIDLIAIAKTLWEGRKTIIWSMGIALFIGVFVAFLSPKQYSVSSVIVPQYSGKSSGGGLSALASMAGINIGSGDNSGEISPLLYPQIVQSVPFQLELMNTPVHFQKVDHPVSIYKYYTEIKKPSILDNVKKYTLGLPGIIISAIRPKNESIKNTTTEDRPQVITLTQKQYAVYNFLKSSVVLDANSKEGYLTLDATMPEPVLAAEVGQLAQDLLQKFVIDFKTQKSKQELGFIQERYDVAKSEMERKQFNAAASTDRTKFLTTTTAQISTTRAQTNFTISNAVFMELAKQLEQAKIQVKKDTPTFTIVQPVTIPIEPSGGGKMIKLIIALFLGTTFGIGFIFVKKQFPILKEKFNDGK